MHLDYEQLNITSQTVGSSFYILDIEKFKNNYNELTDAFCQYYPNTQIAYSYKTNYIPSVCRTVYNKGGYAEVVSDMEYELAIRIGVDPKKIIVNGPYKPLDELEKYLINGSIVNLDSYNEVDSLWQIIEKESTKIFNVGLRCNFDIGSGETSRFGFDTENSQFYTLVNRLIDHERINFINLHCHFPNRDLKYSSVRVDGLIDIYRKIHRNGQPAMIDIGGGLGGKLCDTIRKQLSFDVANYGDYANVIAKSFQQEFKDDKIPPILVLEPGTALVADTVEFVCRVLEIKNIRGEYFAMTSGSKLNFNPMASTINLPVRIYSNENKSRKHYDSLDISGYTCMEKDYIHKNYKGKLGIDDFIVIENVGSYSVVFKPPFIRPNVPIITFEDKQIKVLKNQENFDNIFKTYKLD